jgi:hypothetical protein
MWEVSVQLDGREMERLLGDEGFMAFVEGTAE